MADRVTQIAKASRGFVLKNLLAGRKERRTREPVARIEVEPETTVVKMKQITKRFSGVLANDHIDFEVKTGEIHALLGENGAGKTTLMNILYGLYRPDDGEIFIRDNKVVLKSPRDAINLGIGMVHQHFMLVPPLTVTENVILGLRCHGAVFVDMNGAEKEIANLCKRYGLEVDPKAKIWQLSVGEQQRVEIIKALYRGAEILILDEPTAVLSPPEIEEFFVTLRSMTEEGKSVVLITHKLQEVMAISNRITILRKGRMVGTVLTSDSTVNGLVKMMVGQEVLSNLEKNPVKTGKTILEVKNLGGLNDKGIAALKNISFSVREGEILGIAGVAGNGQKELVETIIGLRKATEGKISINGLDVTKSSISRIIRQGVSCVPEDRLGMALVRSMSIADNLVLKSCRDPAFSKWSILNKNAIDQYCEKLISDFRIMTPSKDQPCFYLSGGNLQKLVLARELSMKPKLLIVVQPTRGLDVAATELIHSMLLKQRDEGTAILVVSEDLDEILSLSDRIAVIYEGKIIGIVPAEKANIEEIGLMMTGTNNASSKE